MPSAKDDPRHNARVITLQKLFERAFAELDLSKKKGSEYNDRTLKQVDEIVNYDKKLVQNLFSGVISNQAKIDAIITKLAPQWPLHQIAKTDLQILRIAIYEGFILKVTPERVAIDEAIELAKEFTNEQSRKFINGVLGNLIINKRKYNLDETNS